MKEICSVIYEADDYKKLDDMSIEEIIDELVNINNGWLPKTRYYGEDEYEGDESDYRAYKRHKALRLAIEILKKERSGEE